MSKFWGYFSKKELAAAQYGDDIDKEELMIEYTAQKVLHMTRDMTPKYVIPELIALSTYENFKIASPTPAIVTELQHLQLIALAASGAVVDSSEALTRLDVALQSCSDPAYKILAQLQHQKVGRDIKEVANTAKETAVNRMRLEGSSMKELSKLDEVIPSDPRFAEGSIIHM